MVGIYIYHCCGHYNYTASIGLALKENCEDYFI